MSRLRHTAMRKRETLAAFALLIVVNSAQSVDAQTPLPREKILASNSVTHVTYADFEAELARVPQKDQFEFLLEKQRIAKLVDNILLNRVLADEARQRGVDKDPRAIAEIRNQTEKVLAKYLGQQVQENAPKINLQALAREKYLTNPAKYKTAEAQDIWHALVQIKGRTREEALDRANMVRRRVLAGETLSNIAAEYSDDPPARETGGVLAGMQLAQLDPSFAKAIKDLPLGGVSQVFETPFGFHVARILTKDPSKTIPFEDVKVDLLHEVDTQHRLGIWEQHIQKILRDPKLSVDTAALDAIRSKIPDLSQMPKPAALKSETSARK